MKNYQLLIAAAVTVLTVFVSCKESDTNLLQEAQLCLNKATAGTARACVSKISSDLSPLANSLRCSAIFISEGFSTPSSFIDALESLNTAGGCTGGCSSSVNAMLAFHFKSADVTTVPGRTANNATADEAFTFCTASDAKIYAQIASLFKLGTRTSMLAYATVGATIDEDDLKAELANLNDTEIGDLVTITYQTSCANIVEADASESTVKQCTELNAAIGSCTTSAAIGACMKAKLDNPAAVCCP